MSNDPVLKHQKQFPSSNGGHPEREMNIHFCCDVTRTLILTSEQDARIQFRSFWAFEFRVFRIQGKSPPCALPSWEKRKISEINWSKFPLASGNDRLHQITLQRW
ncbi:hypothetical protein AVEN_187024-1 [Araneus ventricosus]|uniref:Uncharacterized protein n=1 Tax=Araneus ventricosus TaxID=182803 RepID=A0A4Y2HBE5_ARAVE|nr:hypothetical protein AVEN_187024-1 [Araneus ventricosus]